MVHTDTRLLLAILLFDQHYQKLKNKLIPLDLIILLNKFLLTQ